MIHSTAHPEKAWVIRVTGTDLDKLPRYHFRKQDRILGEGVSAALRSAWPGCPAISLVDQARQTDAGRDAGVTRSALRLLLLPLIAL